MRLITIGKCERCKKDFSILKKIASNGLHTFNSIILNGLEVCLDCGDDLTLMHKEADKKMEKL